MVWAGVVNALKAHVENGRIIVDDPTDLPEGTVLQLVLAGDDMGFDAEERQKVLRAIDEGLAAARRGEHVDAADFVVELKYEPAVFPSGDFFGTPEEEFDVGAVYLQG
jgi:hypothetical protein